MFWVLLGASGGGLMNADRWRQVVALWGNIVRIAERKYCPGQNNIKGQPLQWWQARKSWRSAEKRQLTLSKWVLLVCGPYSFFLSDNIIKSGKYDWSLCYVSVGGSIFKAHTVDWVVNEGTQATVEKNSNFCLIWSEARWGGWSCFNCPDFPLWF